MELLKNWINVKFAEVSVKLPTISHTEPASLCCGYNTGYKSAILDLQEFLLNDNEKYYALHKERHANCNNIDSTR